MSAEPRQTAANFSAVVSDWAAAEKLMGRS